MQLQDHQPVAGKAIIPTSIKKPEQELQGPFLMNALDEERDFKYVLGVYLLSGRTLEGLRCCPGDGPSHGQMNECSEKRDSSRLRRGAGRLLRWWRPQELERGM